MRKMLLPVIAITLACAAFPAFAEWELGVSWTPVPNAIVDGGSGIDSMTGYHMAYVESLFYASWDVLSVPDRIVGAWTGYHEDGCLSFLDAGLRLSLRPVVCFAEAGVNNLFIHDNGFVPEGFGANVRLGAGVKFGWWGVTLTGTSVFPSWDDLSSAVSALWTPETRPAAWAAFERSLVPSVLFIWYLR
jgi:hypothetical protein